MLEQGDALCRNLAKKASRSHNQTPKAGREDGISLHYRAKEINYQRSLTQARNNEAELLNKFADIKILLYWLRVDILSLVGPDWSERMELMNFIISELQLRESKTHKGIKALRVALSNQKSDLLAFAEVIDHKLRDIAQKFQISLSQVREVCFLMKKSLSTNVYWQKWNQLYKLLSEKFLPVKEAVESAMKSTPRVSSLVENLNSRRPKLLFLEKASKF